MRRGLILGIAIIAVLSGCSVVPRPDAYKLGFTAALTLARTETLRAAGPAAQCALFNAKYRSYGDNEEQWLAGCRAALKDAHFVHSTRASSN